MVFYRQSKSHACGIETARGQAELVQPARHSIEHTDNPNRAHKSRTESEAKSMATQVNPLEDPAPSAKAGRRGSKAKEQQAEYAAPSDTDFPDAGQEADPQQELDTLENQADAPVRGSYLREKDGYDALSPEQKAVCDKDFESYLDRLTRPIEVKEGETRQDAIQRAKEEYCAARQEHTAHHREMAKTMLASKINCLNSEYPRNSFSLRSPDVAKEFLATAFYHNASAAKGLTSFDKDVFAASKKAALREFSALAASVENGGSATKEFNNTFALCMSGLQSALPTRTFASPPSRFQKSARNWPQSLASAPGITPTSPAEPRKNGNSAAPHEPRPRKN